MPTNPAVGISRRRGLASRAVLLAIGLASLPALADERLGPYGNRMIGNPHDTPESGGFGRSVGAGDFDGDGVGDLAVWSSGGKRIRIMRGVAAPITADPQTIRFTSTTVELPSSSGLGPLVAGDFDNDGRDELAVGAEGASVDGINQVGKVFVLDRASNGTWSVQSEIRAGGIYPGSPLQLSRLGSALAAGDFDADGYTDLAIGMPGQNIGSASTAGAVMATYGSASGINGIAARIFTRANDGLGFQPTEFDQYGTALGAGDFDGDGADDLAIGVPNADCPDGVNSAGAVVVLRGDDSIGLSNTQPRILRPGINGMAGQCNDATSLGWEMAVGRFDLDATADLAVTAIDASGGNDDAVHVLYGSASGLSTSTDQRFVSPPLPNGTGSSNGYFGDSLATGKLRRRCLICPGDSLAIGAPRATIASVGSGGMVWTIDAAVGGRLDPATITPILPSTLAIGANSLAYFGQSLATADFNGDGQVDLAVGAYGYENPANINTGAVQVIYQSEFLFINGFD